MTTFLTLKNLVYQSLGRDDTDEWAALLVPAAINFAQVVTALIFRPPELDQEKTVVVASGNSKASFAAANSIEVVKVYNVTDGCELHFVPFELWDAIVPTQTTVRFYSIYGENIHVKYTPAANKTLTLYCLVYPTELTQNDQEVDFEHHDSYIVSAATAICFASMEEAESVNVWGSVLEALGMPFLKGSRLREVIAGKQALLESAIAQASEAA